MDARAASKSAALCEASHTPPMRGPVQDESGALDPLDALAMAAVEGELPPSYQVALCPWCPYRPGDLGRHYDAGAPRMCCVDCPQAHPNIRRNIPGGVPC